MYEFMCNFSYFLVCDQCQPTSFKKTHDVTWTRFSPAHLGLPNLRTLRSKSGLHLQNCQMALGLSENRGDLQMAIGHYHRENGHEHEVQFGFGGYLIFRLVVYLPSEKYESQLGSLFPIYGKIENVPNHQSDIVVSDEIINPIIITVPKKEAYHVFLSSF